MIKIKECGEPLVDIKKLCPDLIIDLGSRRMKKAPTLRSGSRHPTSRRIVGKKTAYLRKTVAEMVCKAKSHLPKGMTFVINDAWRSQDVQKEIFQGFVKRFTIKEAEKYVAPFEGKHVSGHMTGGAVDLRIWKNNRKVPMKSSKLTYQENAKSFQPKLPSCIQKNRQIMFNALRKAGLSNFSKEFWHWSYGDIWWARRKKKNIAIYGVVNKKYV